MPKKKTVVEKSVGEFIEEVLDSGYNWGQDDWESQSVKDKLNAGDYNTRIVYPDKPRRPECCHMTAVDILRQSEELIQDYRQQVASYDSALIEYDETQKRYYNDIAAKQEQFRKDLAKEHGVENHPKEPILWAKAWERGHDAGLVSVYEEYVTLVELLKGN